jgi:ribonuclease Z
MRHLPGQAADLLSPPRQGKKVVLLGDTSDATSLAEAAHGCDLIVHEVRIDVTSHHDVESRLDQTLTRSSLRFTQATYDNTLEQKAIEGGHSTSTMAGRFAHSIEAKKLVLTHFSMRYTTAAEGELGVADLQREAQKECPHTTVVCAEDFSVFDI